MPADNNANLRDSAMSTNKVPSRQKVTKAQLCDAGADVDVKKEFWKLTSELRSVIKAGSEAMRMRFQGMACLYLSELELGELFRSKTGMQNADKIVENIMMLQWSEIKKAELLVKILKDTGFECGTMAEKLRSFYLTKASQKNDASEFDENHILDQAIIIVASKISEQWKFFLRCLYLDEALIADCSQQPGGISDSCSYGLRKWKEAKGNTATVYVLIKALCQANFFAVAEEIVFKLCSSDRKCLAILDKHHDDQKTGDSFQTKSKNSSQSNNTRANDSMSSTASIKIEKKCTAFANCAKSTLTLDASQREVKNSKTFDCVSKSRRAVEVNERLAFAKVNTDLACFREVPEASDEQPASSGTSSDSAQEPSLSVEEKINYAKQCIPFNSRHIQIVAIGQTSVGKTKTINRVFGTLAAPEGCPGQGSTTDEIRTYHRIVQSTDGHHFQLSFTDTPGFGDSKNRFSDARICRFVKREFIKNATVVVLYFEKLGSSFNFVNINFIKLFEKITKHKIDAIVFTCSAWKPDFDSFSDDKSVEEVFAAKKATLASRNLCKRLLREYLDCESENAEIFDFDATDETEFASQWNDKTKKKSFAYLLSTSSPPKQEKVL